VCIVPPGHVARLTRGASPLTTRYWDPPRARREPGGRGAERDHACALRDLLVQIVRDEFPRDGSGLVWLSGGVDSSCLAALVERESIPYSTLSLLPPGSGPVRSREMSYIESASPHAERHHLSDLDPERYATLPSQAPARLVHCLHPALPVTLRVANAHGYRSVMGGELADEICGGAYTSPDWTRDTSLGELGSRARRGELGLRSVLRWSKHALLRAVERPLVPVANRLPSCFSPEMQREYAAYRAGWQRRVLDDPATNSTLFAHTLGTEFPAMSWEILAPHGLHRVLPFVNRAAYEWALLTHPTERFDPGTKRLLRQALEELVPERNLGRADKGSLGVRWPESLVSAPAVPVHFEPLFEAGWLERLRKTRVLPLRERTVVEFLVVFDRATRQARSGQPG
jgi:asparagine synthetase B (glutamine-hydrolysing)